ncbi:MAG: hypothetical protein AUJ98_05090 [Bacteroidetes bacterium CG2_30_33_31]|nr:MAG: hypothetical protein AUJ98_05090 [Bacteroidetes bacterium CG2_30_33_31]
MKRVFMFLAIFATSSLLITSCGGSASTDENAVDSTAVVADTTAAVVEAPAAVLGDAVAGKDIYNQACMACHASGAAGATKLDDKAKWDAIAAQGLAVIYQHSIEGFQGANGMMPAKGGNASLTDQNVNDAVTFMLSEAKVEAK